jgi:hypothetical protein
LTKKYLKVTVAQREIVQKVIEKRKKKGKTTAVIAVTTAGIAIAAAGTLSRLLACYRGPWKLYRCMLVSSIGNT